MKGNAYPWKIRSNIPFCLYKESSRSIHTKFRAASLQASTDYKTDCPLCFHRLSSVRTVGVITIFGETSQLEEGGDSPGVLRSSPCQTAVDL